MESWSVVGDTLSNVLYRLIDSNGRVVDFDDSVQTILNLLESECNELAEYATARDQCRPPVQEEAAQVITTCADCGGIIGDQAVHVEWHRRQAAVAQQAQSAAAWTNVIG